MSYHRYTLERYRCKDSRYTCPNCGKPKEFVRYIDTKQGNYLADHVGRCNREVNCGYHYTPKQYFADNKLSYIDQERKRPSQIRRIMPKVKQISYIPFEIFQRSLIGYAKNYFVEYLIKLFGANTACKLVEQFYIGTSSYWEGATIFWQIDAKWKTRSGKIMLYHRETGKRVKDELPDGSKKSYITWAHSVLMRQGIIQQFNLRQCLFGEHQLATQPISKPIAIVESEKTAIIASVHLPEFIWLACGSLSNLTSDKCRVLESRKIVMFPDLNCFNKWSEKAKQLKTHIPCNITISDLLERRASKAERAQGLDLADYLLRFNAGQEAHTAEIPTIPKIAENETAWRVETTTRQQRT